MAGPTSAAALAAALGRMAGDLGDLTAPDEAAGELLAARALPRVPRRSGRLAGTVRATGPTVTAGGPGVGYVHPVHNGSRFMPARPFLTDTLTASTADVVDVYAAHLNTTIQF